MLDHGAGVARPQSRPVSCGTPGLELGLKLTLSPFCSVMAYTPQQAWHQWDVQAWNWQLLRFCFVADADASPDQGLRASEEDLLELTGDRQSNPRTMAEKLIQALERPAQLRNRTPADFALNHQMKHYTPSAPEEPPFFAFLWLTCLIAHGYPDPDQEGKFHARYEAVFDHQDHQGLRRLTEAWGKLSEWLTIEGIFEGERHRQLKLPPIDAYRSKISHSWWLSFPRLADCRLLQKHLRNLQQRHRKSLKASDPQLIRDLLAEREFSKDFKKELNKWQQALNKKPDAETGFSLFLDRVIRDLQAVNGKSLDQALCFGPLILCSYGDLLGVLLLADGIPQLERNGWHEEPGKGWCEKLNEQPLLIPNDLDPQYAAFEGGSLAIDREKSPITRLHPLINRGLLPFELDPDLRCPRLLLSLSAEQRPSHVVLFEENCEAFLNKFGGIEIDSFDLEKEGWICIRDFDATARKLKTFATSGAAPDDTDPPPRLTLRRGLRVQGGFLARGLGLPSVRVQFRQPAQAINLSVPQEESPISYIPDQDNPEWNPSEDSRKKTAFQPGAARIVASFTDVSDQESTFQLKNISSYVQLKRSQPIAYREDWGCKLGPINLEMSKPGDFDLGHTSTDKAKQLLSNGNSMVNPQFEQQILDALCAVFQRRPGIKRREFQQLYRQLGGMSSPWPLFYEGLLRAWCEGGWLEEGLEKSGQWNLQPIDPRLVRTSPMGAQVVGLLSVAGLQKLLALAMELEMAVKPVDPACAWLPRGWRFCGEIYLLAEFSGLPLVAQEDWVEDLDGAPLWVVEPSTCDGRDWPRSARDTYFHEEQLCGARKESHLDYSQPPGQRFQDDDRASPSQAVIRRERGFGQTRWHSPDDGHGPFVSCHRNRAALHCIHGATNGLWPFGFPDRQRPLIERFYDADAYLPLPIGRFAALKGRQLPGPTLPSRREQHTYSYWFDQDTGAMIRDEAEIPLINSSPRPHA